MEELKNKLYCYAIITYKKNQRTRYFLTLLTYLVMLTLSSEILLSLIVSPYEFLFILAVLVIVTSAFIDKVIDRFKIMSTLNFSDNEITFGHSDKIINYKDIRTVILCSSTSNGSRSPKSYFVKLSMYNGEFLDINVSTFPFSNGKFLKNTFLKKKTLDIFEIMTKHKIKHTRKRFKYIEQHLNFSKDAEIIPNL